MSDCNTKSDSQALMLWTFQPFDAVISAWDNGNQYRCVPSISSYGGEASEKEGLDGYGSIDEAGSGEDDCSKQFRMCYRWVAAAMDRYGIIRPNGIGDDAYPIWAWAKWTGNKSELKTKPDLRYMAFNQERLIDGNALFAFEMNRGDILLSDFDLWHLPLNGLPIDDGDIPSIKSVHDNNLDTPSIMETWNRCIVPSNASLADMPKWTQACVWELRQSDYRYIKRLN